MFWPRTRNDIASSRLMVPSRMPWMHWHPAITRRSQRTRPSRRSRLRQQVVAGEPQVVDRLPRLAGDHRTGGAEIGPSGGQGRQDRRVVPFTVQEELDDVLLGGPGVVGTRRRLVALGELRIDAGDGQERLPSDVLADRQVHVGVGVDLDDPRRPLGPFQVSPGPVHGLGHSCQQHRPAPSVLEFIRVPGDPAPVGGDPVAPGAGSRGGPTRDLLRPDDSARWAHARPRSVSGGSPAGSTTQVSLLPPPWDEFTTSDPSRRATRVSPPRVT